MIQFNLLPDIKREYEKARRIKRLTFLIASISAAVSLAIFIVTFVTVQVFQKDHSQNLSDDIQAESSKLEGVPDINKILTIQNQLNSLTSLHEQKPVATRLLKYLQQLTPAQAKIANVSTDFELGTMSISGSADALSTVNKFVDTLKFTKYQIVVDEQPSGEPGDAFSAVVLSGFNRSATAQSVTYQISLRFDPLIFAGENDVQLIVPTGQITTRSQTEKPEAIFETPADPTQTGGE